MRITPLRGAGVAWLKCLSCRLKLRPGAVAEDGICPRCGHGGLLRLAFGKTTPRPAPRPSPLPDDAA